MNTRIYADNNATTALAPEVLQAVSLSLGELYGNPSSKHRVGDAARAAVTAARVAVAMLIGAQPAEIVFTSGATESNHLAITAALAREPARRHVVVSAVEHASTLMLLDRLEQDGVRVSRIAVDAYGLPDLDQLRAVVTPQTALVSMMWVNNETGVILPVQAAATIAAAQGVPFHSDAVQAVGRLPLHVGDSGCDLLSFSGHKLHAPKGIGVLWVRKGFVLSSLLAGHQERNRRGGTENVPAIVGLGVAATLAAQRLDQDAVHIARVRDLLESALQGEAVSVNGGGVPRVANTSNLQFSAVEAGSLIERLDRQGICVSGGAACTARGTQASHVLRAMGQSEQQALSAVRFSFSRYSTAEEAQAIAMAVRELMQPGLARVV